MYWLEDPMAETEIGGVSDPKGPMHGDYRTDPHPVWEGLPRHQPGEPDEPGFIDTWWAGVCGSYGPESRRPRRSRTSSASASS